LCEYVTDASMMRTNLDLTAMEMIYQFNKLKTPKFGGGTYSMVYEEWLRRMKNLLEIMECPKRFKVRLATYQFEREVEFCWGTVKPRK